MGKSKKLIPAAVFKKMIAKDVNEMVQDKQAGETFLEKVQKIKVDRRKRNIKAMIANSLDPSRKEVDFRKENINDLYDAKKLQKVEQKQEIVKIKR